MEKQTELNSCLNCTTKIDDCVQPVALQYPWSWFPGGRVLLKRDSSLLEVRNEPKQGGQHPTQSLAAPVCKGPLQWPSFSHFVTSSHVGVEVKVSRQKLSAGTLQECRICSSSLTLASKLLNQYKLKRPLSLWLSEQLCSNCDRRVRRSAQCHWGDAWSPSAAAAQHTHTLAG